jgi:hypothetical protein
VWFVAEVRWMFVLFEHDDWSPNSVAGRRYLKGLMQCFPDNKIVEDVHSVIRRDAKANANEKLTLTHMQALVVRSGVLESRGIKHRALPTQDAFIRQFKHTKVSKARDRYISRSHKLHERWFKIMLRKTWATMDEKASGDGVWGLFSNRSGLCRFGPECGIGRHFSARVWHWT